MSDTQLIISHKFEQKFDRNVSFVNIINVVLFAKTSTSVPATPSTGRNEIYRSRCLRLMSLIGFISVNAFAVFRVEIHSFSQQIHTFCGGYAIFFICLPN